MAKIERLKASTILEVVIAMTVVLVVMTTAMAIINNVNKGSLSVRKLKSRLILENELRSAAVQNCEDKKLDNGWMIKCAESANENKNGTRFIHLLLLDENNIQLAEVEKMVMIENEKVPSL